MPVVLPESAWDEWLDPRPRDERDDLEALARLLGPAPDEWFEAYPVSPRVNRVVDHDAELARPVDHDATS
jgi:putative SOS response-associated peptidase YedK